MPFKIGVFVQSVVVLGKVYVAGSKSANEASSSINHTVLEYDNSSGEWTTLPQYKGSNFAMTAINSQLVLVGGSDAVIDKILGVWDQDRKWIHPYPEMPTARSNCSALVYDEYLAVAGGWAGSRPLSSVDILNTGTNQWHSGPTMPIPWYNMKAAVVGDMCYFMGGSINEMPTKIVYSISMQSLLTPVVSSEQVWKKITGLQLTGSCPLSIGGSLLAVGGRSKGYKPMTAIHLYQPDSGEWRQVGELTFPRYDCTCAKIMSRELLVTGGHGEHRQQMSRMDLATVQLSN